MLLIDHLLKLEDELVRVLRDSKPMTLSDEENEAFQEATKCQICNKELGKDAVRDHCHVMRKVRGAAHSNCNLNLRLKERIPVIFHNLKGYDAYHIMNVIV